MTLQHTNRAHDILGVIKGAEAWRQTQEMKQRELERKANAAASQNRGR